MVKKYMPTVLVFVSLFVGTSQYLNPRRIDSAKPLIYNVERLYELDFRGYSKVWLRAQIASYRFLISLSSRRFSSVTIVSRARTRSSID